jgi:very-short-patch-repair endonuclease
MIETASRMKSYFIRERRKPVSNAENKIYGELVSRGLHPWDQYEFRFIYQMDEVGGTSVDFFFPKKNLVVFIDGPHHLKQCQDVKDELIDIALKRRNMQVLRFDYKPPITKHKVIEICDKIEQALKEVKKVVKPWQEYEDKKTGFKVTDEWLEQKDCASCFGSCAVPYSEMWGIGCHICPEELMELCKKVTKKHFGKILDDDDFDHKTGMPFIPLRIDRF